MFGWFKPASRERRKKVRVDRKLLEERPRRFRKSYLEADEARKPQFYRAVDDVSRKCHSTEPPGLAQSDFENGRIAEQHSRRRCKWCWIARIE